MASLGPTRDVWLRAARRCAPHDDLRELAAEMHALATRIPDTAPTAVVLRSIAGDLRRPTSGTVTGVLARARAMRAEGLYESEVADLERQLRRLLTRMYEDIAHLQRIGL